MPQHSPASDAPRDDASLDDVATLDRATPRPRRLRKIAALAAGGSVPIDGEADERAVMLVGGEASLDGEALMLYSLYVLKPGEPMMLGSAKGGKVMLMGGEAFPQRRHVWWNFVASSRERIEQAKEDWRAGRFALVPGDTEEFIPLPDKPKTVSYP